MDVNTNSTESAVLSSTLFVYGSFYEGMVHFERIAPFISKKEDAVLKATAYRLDAGYPVLLLEGEDTIRGQLVSIEAPETLWKLLDEFHGYSLKTPEKSLFFRASVEVEVNGEKIHSCSYVMNPIKLPRSAQKIENGDWQGSITAREPMVKTLTVNQRTYVQKLGRSTGRDIVPINLDLYRELMNKGLIVDKGRRLALTSLGQEVFRYLE
ncbi:MAG: gamma-glutamylcyclotransferase [Bdellovibrionales bacterium]